MYWNHLGHYLDIYQLSSSNISILSISYGY
nr:MAG TPA: hypothetical protein [Caudoviricetes sp.]